MSRTDLLRNPEVFDQQRDESGLFGGIFEFDPDDPDFAQSKNATNLTTCGSASSLNQSRTRSISSVNGSSLRRVKTSPMTLAGIPYLADYHSGYSSDDELMESTESDADSAHHLTIENLRHQLNSCFSCGVSWQEEHVSLDCAECGGYSLTRPCPLCDGKCGQKWKRDLATSHSLGKANWSGSCSFNQRGQGTTDLLSHQFTCLKTSNS